MVHTSNPTKSGSFPTQNNLFTRYKKQTLQSGAERRLQEKCSRRWNWQDNDVVVTELRRPEIPFKERLVAGSLESKPSPAVSCFRVGLTHMQGFFTQDHILPWGSPHWVTKSGRGYRPGHFSWAQDLLAILAPELPARWAEAWPGLIAVGLLPLRNSASTHFLSQALIPNKHLYLIFF